MKNLIKIFLFRELSYRLLMFLLFAISGKGIVSSKSLWTSIDSVFIDIKFWGDREVNCFRITVSPKGSFCERRKTYQLHNKQNGIRDQEREIMDETLIIWSDKHKLDSSINSDLQQYIDSLFITRKANIITHFKKEENIFYNESQNITRVKIFSSHGERKIEDCFTDELSTCLNRVEIRFDEDTRLYSDTYFDFQLLLHYIAISEGASFRNRDAIIATATKRFFGSHGETANTIPKIELPH